MEGWLQHQKEIWKKRKETKQKQKARFVPGVSDDGDAKHSSSSSRATVKDGLRSYMRSAGNELLSSSWQIIQVVEDDSRPGIFRLWVMLQSNAIRFLEVEVPRIIYVNMRVPDDSKGRKVERLLPRGRPCINLYELHMDEAKWIEQSKDLTSFLTQSDVEGVYEGKVPLVYRLMMEIGCICKVDRRRRKLDEKKGNLFALSDLQYKSTSEQPYLRTAPVRSIYFYHSFHETRGGVWALLLEPTSEALIIGVNPYSGELPRINLRTLLNECYESFSKQEQGMEPSERRPPPSKPPAFTFDIQTVADNAGAHALIRDKLARYRQSQPHAIVLSQCPDDLVALYAAIPILRSDFPVVSIAHNEVDNAYETLGWYRVAVKRMFQRYIQAEAWWYDQIVFCGYGHVPIGNLEADYPAFVLDMLYARTLRQNNHLLWMSPHARPDMGGFEEDDNYFADEHTNPEVIEPGCYRKVCVEMEVHHLAVNSVLQSHLIEQLEGGMGLAEQAKSDNKEDAASIEYSSTLSGTYACRDAFKILKNLVFSWFQETVQNGNPDSDLLLRHLYRWLRSSTSTLYDPALHRMVHKMMKKVFLQFLARFRKLGAKVVHSKFNKLIICTNKPTPALAKAYTNFVLETIKKRELFTYILVDTTRYWETLIFMDAANFGGIQYKEPGSDDPSDPSDPSSASSSIGDDPASGSAVSQAEEIKRLGPRLVIQWNIALYLPLLAQTHFGPSISNFCMIPYLRQKQLYEMHLKNRDLVQTEEQREADFQRHLGTYVDTEFTRQLLKGVKTIKQESGGEDSQFPELAGSHLALQNPALEFVKSICYVVSLDPLIEREAARLRANLLKLVDSTPFEEKAQFINPCQTFILPDVICSYCNLCRDLDLCRDPDLVQHNWKCTFCFQTYDQSAIESQLLDIVNRRAVGYQVQDLACVRCRRIKVPNLAVHCTCAGKFIETITPDDFRTGMSVFLRIARFHQFAWLQETVEWLLEVESSSSSSSSQDGEPSLPLSPRTGTPATQPPSQSAGSLELDGRASSSKRKR